MLAPIRPLTRDLICKVEASTLEHANAKVKEAYEAFNEIKIDPIMHADLVGGGDSKS